MSKKIVGIDLPLQLNTDPKIIGVSVTMTPGVYPIEDVSIDARVKLIAKNVKEIIRQGNFAEAESLLIVGLREYPDHPRLLNSLTQIALRRGDLNEAERRSKQELAVSPQNPVALYTRIKLMGLRSPTHAIQAIIAVLTKELNEHYIYLLAFFLDSSAQIWKVLLPHINPNIQNRIRIIWENREAIEDFEFERILFSSGAQLWETGALPVNQMASHEFTGKPDQ